MRPKIVTIAENSPDSGAANVPSVAYVGGLSYFDAISIVATIQGATGDTLDVYLQTSYELNPDWPADHPGRIWYDYAHFQQLADGASPVTVALHVNRSTSVTAETTIGTGISPALGVSTIMGGAWGDMLRILFVPGASTTAGSEQVLTIIGQTIAR